MKELIIIRHGQSQWNLEDRFTGWVDVPLSAQGISEAKKAGQILKSKGLVFDQAYTSYLKRAINTLWFMLDEMELQWIPQEAHWRLNERHYGGLQGLNKAETRKLHGEEKVFQWRRSFDILPPPASGVENEKLKQDLRYREVVKKGLFPEGESLKTTKERVLPYWEEQIRPKLVSGKKVLIVAHGNSLRSLFMHLTNMTSDEIMGFEFKTATPLRLELNDNATSCTKYDFYEQ